MISVEIQIPASPDTVERLKDFIARPRALYAAAGARVANDLRAHFATKNAQPNKRGWPKRNFWNRIRTATAMEFASDSAARIAISDPAINQRVYGGTITPKRGKYLAIPARQEAYRAGSPREANADRLEVAFNRFGQPYALVERQATQIRRTKKGFRKGAEVGGGVWYFLVKSVTQQPDPSALPPTPDLEAGAAGAVQDRLDLEIERLKK